MATNVRISSQGIGNCQDSTRTTWKEGPVVLVIAWYSQQRHRERYITQSNTKSQKSQIDSEQKIQKYKNRNKNKKREKRKTGHKSKRICIEEWWWVSQLKMVDAHFCFKWCRRNLSLKLERFIKIRIPVCYLVCAGYTLYFSWISPKFLVDFWWIFFVEEWYIYTQFKF